MKSRKIVAVTLLVLALLITAPGCAWWGGGEKPSLEMLKIMPKETTSFIYWNIEALRDNKDLAKFYDNPKSKDDWMGKEGEQLKSFGIEPPSVDYFACGGEQGTTKVFMGNFDHKYIKDALLDLDYEMQSYPNEAAKKWIGPSEEDKAVGLIKDIVIIGDGNSVDDFNDVFTGDKSSLQDDEYAKGIAERLPSGILVMVMKAEEPPKYHRLLAWGVSYEREDEDMLRLKAAYRFDGKGFAEESLLEIKDDWESERDYYKVEAKHKDEFVEVTALMATKNFLYF